MNPILQRRNQSHRASTVLAKATGLSEAKSYEVNLTLTAQGSGSGICPLNHCPVSLWVSHDQCLVFPTELSAS